MPPRISRVSNIILDKNMPANCKFAARSLFSSSYEGYDKDENCSQPPLSAEHLPPGARHDELCPAVSLRHRGRRAQWFIGHRRRRGAGARIGVAVWLQSVGSAGDELGGAELADPYCGRV